MFATVLAAVLVVVSTADGDTLTIHDGDQRIIIRLAEIDAPERTMPYSQVSRRNLARLCGEAKDVRYEQVAMDRYGRAVAHVWCDGVHVNWQQVADGLAWCFPKYLKRPDECLPLEAEARSERRGLWKDAEPMAPWDYRGQNRPRFGGTHQ